MVANAINMTWGKNENNASAKLSACLIMPHEEFAYTILCDLQRMSRRINCAKYQAMLNDTGIPLIPLLGGSEWIV